MMPPMDPFLPDDAKVAALRDALPAVGAGIYLDAAAAGPLPAEVDRAMREADEWELKVGRTGRDRAADRMVVDREARAVLAAVVGADPDRMVLTTGIAAGVTALLLARPTTKGERWALGAGVSPEVVGAARAVARARDVPIEVLPPEATPIAPAGSTTDIRIESGTIGVLIGAHVRADTGFRALSGEPWQAPGPPSRRPSRQSPWRILDASGSVGAIPVPVEELGADAVILPSDRWLLGPEGVAGLWCGSRLDGPSIADIGSGLDQVPRRAMLGLARSVGWLLMYVGLPWVLERTRLLATDLLGRLWAVPGVELITRPERCAATVTFRIAGWSAQEAVDELGRRAFAIVGAVPELGAIRCSVGAWNTDAELARFTDAVTELATHSPSALPRRPRLVVLSPSSPTDPA
jgi:selenocysteine lyase/cysteine desulfurase